MNPNVEPPMRQRNQNPPAKPAVSRNTSKKIREGMSFVVRALKCRPEPRDFWDDISSARADFRHAWLDKTVLKCRQALEASRLEGPGTQAATLQRIERFYAVLLAESVAGYEMTASIELSELLRDLAHDDAEVLATAADVQHETNEGTLEAIRFTAMRSIHTSERVLERASSELARVHQPLAVSR